MQTNRAVPVRGGVGGRQGARRGAEVLLHGGAGAAAGRRFLAGGERPVVWVCPF